MLIRDSVQSSGNRTKAIYCGNSPGQGAKALENAIRDGCAKKLTLNTALGFVRARAAPVGEPVGLHPARAGQQDVDQRGRRRPVRLHAEQLGDRRTTAPGRRPALGVHHPHRVRPHVPGRANNDWLPVEGLLRVYVTGWDGGQTCNQNDDPPRGYDDKGAQLWGHFVQPITIDPAVIVGDGKCDLTNDNIQCSPRLVR